MSRTNITHLIQLALLWLVYFTVHSALASVSLKTWAGRFRPRGMRYYRLAFNVVATLSLAPIAWLSYRYPGPKLWAWTGALAWLADVLSVAALIGFAHSARYYDMSEFLGLRQWRMRAPGLDDKESFRISPWHRHVRHPWYALGLVLLWTQDMSAALFLSASMMTCYLWIGARLEERKLIARYGIAYRRYMQRVPGLIPRPWKSISAQEAAELMAEATRHSGT